MGIVGYVSRTKIITEISRIITAMMISDSSALQNGSLRRMYRGKTNDNEAAFTSVCLSNTLVCWKIIIQFKLKKNSVQCRFLPYEQENIYILVMRLISYQS